MLCGRLLQSVLSLLSITAVFTALALAVVLRHQALRVLPGVDLGGAELAVGEGWGGELVLHRAGRQHSGGLHTLPRPTQLVHRVGKVSVGVGHHLALPALQHKTKLNTAGKELDTISSNMSHFIPILIRAVGNNITLAGAPSTKEGPSNSTLVPCRKETLLVIPPRTFGLQKILCTVGLGNVN